MAFKCLYVFSFCEEQDLAGGNVMLVGGDDDGPLDCVCLCWAKIFPDLLALAENMVLCFFWLT